MEVEDIKKGVLSKEGLGGDPARECVCVCAGTAQREK
jgi:hypothetical protein